LSVFQFSDQKTEMVLKTLVYSPFNHLMWLLAQRVVLNSVALKAFILYITA